MVKNRGPRRTRMKITAYNRHDVASHGPESRSVTAMQPAIPFSQPSLDPAVRGWLHAPGAPNGDALILTHGAGSDSTAPLLAALSETFAGQGYLVLRCDLPFRQERRTGRRFWAMRNAIARALATRSLHCVRMSRAGSFSAATPTVGASRPYSAPPNSSLCPDFCCFRTLCIRRANGNSFAFNICPTCALRACSCMERAIRSEAPRN